MQQLRLFLLIAILSANSFFAAAQTKPELADQAFSQGNYAEAIHLYKDLLNRFAEDPNYNYRLGVAYFLSDTNLEESYKYLKVSSTKDVPQKAYFYLGEVCRYLYRFDESLEYYKRFMVNGGSPDVPTVELEMAASAAVNGQNMLKYGANVDPVAKAVVPEAEFYSRYDTYSVDGGFAPLPDNLKTTLDRKLGNKSIMYSKKNGGDAGDIAVFASYGGGETNSLDLYYMQKKDDGSWTSPTRLPSSINSPFDEAYPYMCPDNKTLYFASKGLFGVGGYDIYRTTYDADSKSWATPENLGYPINSPYDDFLFVPDAESATACFASKRDAISKDEISVLKIGNYGNELKLTLTSSEARTLQALNPEKSKVTEQVADNSVSESAAAPEYEGIEKIDKYRNLKRALQRADNIIDSTNRKLDRLRLAWGDMPDSMRNNIQKLIVYNEGQVAQYTELRTSLAQQINSMEQSYLQGTLRDAAANAVSKEWFVDDVVFAASVTENMKQKLNASPLNMALAMNLIDSVANFEMEINDLHQMQNVASSEEERAAEQKQIGDLKQEQSRTIEALFAKWPAFYSNYYDVMQELGRAVQSNMADPTLIEEARKNSLLANGIRSNTVAVNDVEKRYRMVEEAFKAEQRAVVQLHLYLAQEANRTELADSLKKVLHPEKVEEEAGDAPVATTAKTGNFGSRQREAVEFSDRSVDAPEVEPGEFVLNEAPAYSKEMPFPSIEVLPQGVAYSIQLGMFSQTFNYRLFRFSPMFYDNMRGDTKKLYAGIFLTYAHAQNGLKTVKSNGFKDAFIVAFSNKKLVTMAQAKQHEGKQQVKPEALQENDINAMYRVVVGTFEGEMPANIKEAVQKLLSNKELIKSIMPSGDVTYSIGNFNNFDDALLLKDRLMSDGVIEAFVTKIDLNKTIE